MSNRYHGSRFFTKPLQGALFKRLSDIIMGFKEVESLSQIQIKERVGNNKKNEEKERNDLNKSDNNETLQKNDKNDDGKMTYAEVVTRKPKLSKQVRFAEENKNKQTATELPMDSLN